MTKKYDLEERTAKFGINVIRFCKLLTLNDLTKPLINQLVRSATSIGANYMEASAADSKKDFKAKIAICRKEAKETKHYQKILVRGEGCGRKLKNLV